MKTSRIQTQKNNRHPCAKGEKTPQGITVTFRFEKQKQMHL